MEIKLYRSYLIVALHFICQPASHHHVSFVCLVVATFLRFGVIASSTKYLTAHQKRAVLKGGLLKVLHGVGPVIGAHLIGTPSLVAWSAVLSFSGGGLILLGDHGQSDLATGNIEILDTNLDGITNGNNVRDSIGAGSLEGRDVDQTIKLTLNTLGELGYIESNKGTKVEDGGNGSLHELVTVVPSIGKSGQSLLLGLTVSTGTLGAVASASSTTGGTLGGILLGLLAAGGDGNLSLGGIDTDDADGDLVAGLDDVLHVGDEVVGDARHVKEGIGLSANVKEGAVGLDGLDGALDGGADLEISKGSARFGAALLLADGGTGRTVGVVGLLIRGDAVHGLNLGGDLGGGIRHAKSSGAAGSAGAGGLAHGVGMVYYKIWKLENMHRRHHE